MTDWLHCNTCFSQPGSGTKFSLTSCGHIYCEKCVEYGCKNRCKMCNSTCNTITLSGQLKPDVGVFFTDPLDLIKKNLRQVIQVVDFQKNHRRRLNSYYKQKNEKATMLQREHLNMTEQLKGLEREISNLRDENAYLKRLIHERSQGVYGKSSQERRSPISQDRRSPGLRASQIQSSPLELHPRSSHQGPSQSQLSNYKISQTMSYGSGGPNVTSLLGRVSVRTPPSGGRMGTVQGTPSPERYDYYSNTPKSVPHPMPFDDCDMNTPPR